MSRHLAGDPAGAAERAALSAVAPGVGVWVAATFVIQPDACVPAGVGSEVLRGRTCRRVAAGPALVGAVGPWTQGAERLWGTRDGRARRSGTPGNTETVKEA